MRRTTWGRRWWWRGDCATGAAAGQILCSGLVVELLGGRRAFRFGEVGALELKGFAMPVAAYEVDHDRDDPAAVLRHTPFTGRAAELARLERRLEEARRGRGGVAMLMGEPGIGKTRTLEEFAETALGQDALVLWGRCYEGEAARPTGHSPRRSRSTRVTRQPRRSRFSRRGRPQGALRFGELVRSLTSSGPGLSPPICTWYPSLRCTATGPP